MDQGGTRRQLHRPAPTFLNIAALAASAYGGASRPEEGDGVPDHAQTLVGYRKAAAQGDAWAQFNLGVDYSEGRNAPQDDVQAYAWFILAASGASPDYLREMATGRRDLQATKMTPAQIAEGQRLARKWKSK
jgi:TPR repeat protein